MSNSRTPITGDKTPDESVRPDDEGKAPVSKWDEWFDGPNVSDDFMNDREQPDDVVDPATSFDCTAIRSSDMMCEITIKPRTNVAGTYDYQALSASPGRLSRRSQDIFRRFD